MNRVVNQFADGGTIVTCPRITYHYLHLMEDSIVKSSQDTHYEARYRDGWYITNRVGNQFKDGAILATGLHLDSVLLE